MRTSTLSGPLGPRRRDQQMIQAGTPREVSLSGAWAILDIGFAQHTSPSCGLPLARRETALRSVPETALTQLNSLSLESQQQINLVIEAPLSVAFSEEGSPCGRSIERLPARDVRGTDGKGASRRPIQTRYWYSGLGCGVMVAALYLIEHLVDAEPQVPVRLFEGFITFKARSKGCAAHLRDVEPLPEIVRNPARHASSVASENLRITRRILYEAPAIYVDSNSAFRQSSKPDPLPVAEIRRPRSPRMTIDLYSPALRGKNSYLPASISA